MTTKPAPSAGRQNSGLVDRTYIVGSRPLKIDGTLRQPGELIPEAGTDWSYKTRTIYLDQGLIEEVNLVTHADRKAFAQQWDTERTARFEAAKVAKEATPTGVYELPAHKMPAPSLVLRCANCKTSCGFDHAVADAEMWECSACGQRQVGEQSRAGTLQLSHRHGGSHAVNHNWKPPSWRES